MNALGFPSVSLGAEVDERFDALFRQHYPRVARVIGRIVRDAGRAEELAVDVFVAWRRHPAAHGGGAEGWLYRVAVRSALDTWRRDRRWLRVQQFVGRLTGAPAAPDQVLEADVEREQVRATLARLRRRDAIALLLWSEEVPYAEIATAVGVRPTSAGSLIRRAQLAFRKDYEAHYGTHA